MNHLNGLEEIAALIVEKGVSFLNFLEGMPIRFVDVQIEDGVPVGVTPHHLVCTIPCYVVWLFPPNTSAEVCQINFTGENLPVSGPLPKVDHRVVIFTNNCAEGLHTYTVGPVGKSYGVNLPTVDNEPKGEEPLTT